MNRRNEHLSRAVAAGIADDPRRGWLFPMEELLSQGAIVSRQGDFFSPPAVADVPTGGEVA
jgi:hypothetical protein